MSNQRYYTGGEGQQQDVPNGLNSNPWQEEQGHIPQNYSIPQQSSNNTPNPWQQQQHQNPSYQNPAQQGYQQNPQQSYQPPQHAPPPRHQERTVDFVPESERGEQFETMQEYELKKKKPDSQEDKDVATLQKEFPDMDGSLIAAIYGDSKSLGATREMLQALA